MLSTRHTRQPLRPFARQQILLGFLFLADSFDFDASTLIRFTLILRHALVRLVRPGGTNLLHTSLGYRRRPVVGRYRWFRGGIAALV